MNRSYLKNNTTIENNLSMYQTESVNDFHKKYRQRLETIVHTYQNKTAVSYLRNNGAIDKLTFQDIWNFIYNAGVSFEKMKLKQGDRAAILSPHSPYAIFMGMALTYYGITIVPIDASLPNEEIEKLISYSDVRAIFTTNTFYKSVCIDTFYSIPCFCLDDGLTITPFASTRIVCSDQNPTVDPEIDIIAILYSSGTTGEMKGIKVTYASVLKAREVFVRLSGLQDFMSYMLVLPFNHIAGFTGAMTYFLTGCEIDFIEDVNAAKLQNGLLQFQPYYFAMVPKVYEIIEQKIRAAIQEKGKFAEHLMNALFKISGFFRKHLGLNVGKRLFHGITAQVFGKNIFGIGTGASPCKDETTKFFLNLGLEWANLYATTETSVPITATGILDKYPVGTVGNVNHNPEIHVKIENPDTNGIGEILVKSDLMMKGYFRRPDLTAKAFHGEYFKTGDCGFIDKKGYLHITGRMKESVILQNGKKVSPSDVDDYYQERLSKYDVASKGIAKQNGLYDELHLFVAIQNNTLKKQNEICKSIQQISMAAPDIYKISGIHFVSTIPRTSVGKVKRFRLTPEDSTSISSKVTETTSIPDQLLNLLRAHCRQQTITMDSKLPDDLGLDSLSVFEVICAINKEFHTSVESYFHNGITVSEIEKIIQYEAPNQSPSDDTNRYPLKRSDKDIRSFKRFIWLSKLIWNIEVSGKNNINPNEQYIFCPNHESHFDGTWIIGMLDDKFKQTICSIAADYLFEKKVYRKGVVRLGGIPVHRTGNTATALKRALECISSEGYSLLIHPEGTRTRDGKLGDFKQGAARLSKESGLQIIPVCITGAYEIFPPHRKIPRLFDLRHFRKYTITISYGAPISPIEISEEEITEKIRQYITGIREKPRK